MVGGVFVSPSLSRSVGKEHLPGAPWGRGSLQRTLPGMLSEAPGNHRLALCLQRLPSLPVQTRVWGQKEAPYPLFPPLAAQSFDFLLKAIVSRGVRGIVAFPFIPPLDVTRSRGHFLLSDAPSPDTGGKCWLWSLRNGLPVPPPSFPKINEKGLRLTWLGSRVCDSLLSSQPVLSSHPSHLRK
jgi:hypothetical protein